MKNIAFLVMLLNTAFFYSFSQNWDWVNKLEGGGANHYCFDLEFDSSQEFIYGVGRYRAQADFYGTDSIVNGGYFAGSRDVFVSKMDTSGNFLWAFAEGGTGSDYANGVAVDENDFIYVTGITSDSAYFGSIGVLSDAAGDMFVAKYDANGNIIWVNTFQGDNANYGVEIQSDKNGFLYIGGVQSGNMNYSIGTLVDPGYFLLKMDTNGSIIWCNGPSNVSGGANTELSALEIYNDKILFGGQIRGTVQFSSITANSYSTSWEDMFFGKMDTSGTIEWIETAGGNGYDECLDLVQDEDAIFVVGSYGHEAYFDTVTVFSNSETISGPGFLNSRDAFLAKYSLDGSSCLWVKDVKSLKADEHHSIVKNKKGNLVVTGGYAGYDYFTSSSKGEVRIIAYNTDGDSLWSLDPTGTHSAQGYLLLESKFGDLYIAARAKGNYDFNGDASIVAPVSKFDALFAKIYPPLDLENDSLDFCLNEDVVVSVPNCFGSPLIHEWYLNNDVSPSSTGDTLAFVNSGIDSVWCVVNNGFVSDTLTYYLLIDSVIVDLDSAVSTCDSVYTINAGSEGEFYDWGGGPVLNDSVLTVSTTGIYTVHVTNSVCATTDSIYVALLDCSNIPIYSGHVIITGQTDGLLIYTDLSDYHLQVFSVNGSKVHESFGHSKDEVIRFQALTDGIFIVRLISYDGHVITKKVFID